MLSPLYLTTASSHAHQQQAAQVYVNDAKILASYLIQLDADTYQTLHLIDKPLEFAYVNRRAQLRHGAGSGASPAQTSASSVQTKFATVKRPLSVDELASDEQAQAIVEFAERFGDLQTGSAQIDLFNTRSMQLATSFQAKPNLQRLATPTRNQVQLEKLARLFRKLPQLKGRLYNLNETNSLNTYFLPVDSDELEQLLEQQSEQQSAANLDQLFSAHVIPDQVLFLRTMGLGASHRTLADSRKSQSVSLNLAKTLPEANALFADADGQLSGQLLSTPLLLQAECFGGGHFRPGITVAEVLVANIPLANGVLHLIERPILVADQVSLLDYINDSGKRLTQLAGALGNKAAPTTVSPVDNSPLVSVNKFRELLAKQREILSTFGGRSDATHYANRSLLAPSDEAFSRLRHDLRALLENDRQLADDEFDAQRADLIERIVKRHIVPQQSVNSHEILAAGNSLETATLGGQSVRFRPTEPLQVECCSATDAPPSAAGGPTTVAKLLQRDLVCSNGVLQVIDRVLGEPEETVGSLLESLVLRAPQGSGQFEVARLVEAAAAAIAAETPVGTPNELATQSDQQQGATTSPELSLVSKTIGAYLDELQASGKVRQLERSVNVSVSLGRLAGQLERRPDWDAQFKNSQQELTYFVPSDLAWLRLQHSQPELFKPLMYFLESFAADLDGPGAGSPPGPAEPQSPAAPAPQLRRPASESSHRLLQVSLLVTSLVLFVCVCSATIIVVGCGGATKSNARQTPLATRARCAPADKCSRCTLRDTFELESRPT